MLETKKAPREMSLSLIGAGSVGGSLIWALSRAGRQIDVVCDTNENTGRSIAQKVGAAFSQKLSVEIGHSDVVLVAVPDTEIESTAREAASLSASMSHQVWLHVSGALPASVLAPLEGKVKGLGSFHPAHVFPKGKITTLLQGTCFGVDGSEAALEIAEHLAEDLNGRSVKVDAKIRALYHAAAVLSSNAVLAVLAEARRALVAVGIDKAIAETLCVTLASSAVQHATLEGLNVALTGPVQRGDADMVLCHLRALATVPSTLSIYREMSRSIVRLANDAGRTDPDSLLCIERLLTSDIESSH
jgi:predicted short-subunit dehydrogenase-like oxidoreductase (DUF2520 family)